MIAASAWRSRAGLLIALGFVAATACGSDPEPARTPIEARPLDAAWAPVLDGVPDEASFVIGVDVDAVRNSAMAQAHRAELDAALTGSVFGELRRVCGWDATQVINRLVGSGTMAPMRFALAVAGVDQPAMQLCAERMAERHGGTVTARGDEVVVDHGARTTRLRWLDSGLMYTADDDGWFTGAFAGRIWPRAGLADLADDIDGRAPIWLIARDLPTPDIVDVVGRAEISDVVVLALTLRVTSVSRGDLMLTAMRTGIGLPPELRRLLRSAVAWRAGDLVEVRITLTAGDLVAIAAQLL